jgi:hypothetical protein
MSVKRTESLLKNVLSWISGNLGTKSGEQEATTQFGEDTILQQVDPVARCPRTGLPLNSGDPVDSCVLSDGSCSELASSGIRVACLRNPCGLVQERRAAA